MEIHLYIHIVLSTEERDNNRRFGFKGEALILAILDRIRTLPKKTFVAGVFLVDPIMRQTQAYLGQVL